MTKAARVELWRDMIDTSEIEPPCNKGRPKELLAAYNSEKFASELDPAEADARLTQHYLGVFFNLINIPVLDVLPGNNFTKWAMDCTHKTTPDRMMLYALMSWASLDCPRLNASSDRAIFKRTVYQEMELLEKRRCLQSVHALLFLAFAEYGDHQCRAGSAAFAKCVDMMFLLELNHERTWSMEARVYDLSATMDAECRRRTFWAVLCFDSHMQLQSPSLRHMSTGDIGIRLPCENRLYDQEWLLQQPCSDTKRGLEASSADKDFDVMSDMAHMVQITRIYADIQSYTTKNDLKTSASMRHIYKQSHRRQFIVRLKSWAENYNDTLRAMHHDHESLNTRTSYSSRSEPHRRVTTCLNMLYHSSQMKLNRWIYHRGMTDFELSTHASNATTHALAVLSLAEQIKKQGGFSTRNNSFISRNFSTVTAIFEAIDIITAIGRVVDILEPGSRIMALMYCALELLAYLGSWWSYDLVQYSEVKERIQTVFRSAEAALEMRKTFFYCSKSIGGVTSKENDLLYGTNRTHYIRLAYSNHSVIGDQDVFQIDTN